MDKDDNGLSNVFKFILILIIIGLAIFLFMKNNKKEFKLDQTVKIGDVNICLTDEGLKDKLVPTKAPIEYLEYISLKPTDTIVELVGTVENLSNKTLVLKEAIDSFLKINNKKYTVAIFYENADGTDFVEQGEQRQGTIEPYQKLTVHLVVVLAREEVVADTTPDLEIAGKPFNFIHHIKL